jgi:hypothetical protein
MTNLLYPVPTGASSLFVHVFGVPDAVHGVLTIRTEQMTLDASGSLDDASVGFRDCHQWTDVVNLYVNKHMHVDFMRGASQYSLIHNSCISLEHPHLALEILDQVVR